MDLARLLVLLCVACALLQQSARAGEPVLFDDGWKFHLGDAAGAQAERFDDANWQAVTLPHDWSIEQKPDQTNASGTGWLPGGVGWYRKTFIAPQMSNGQHLVVEFGAIYKEAEVWINDHSVGKRPYGFIDENYDLTQYLNRQGQPNVLSVRVDHSDFADSRFYTGSGIYRHVYLEVQNPVHVATHGVTVTATEVSSQQSTIHIQTRIVNASALSQNGLVHLSILNEAGQSVGALTTPIKLEPHGEQTVSQSLVIPNLKLWSPDHPNLCSASVEIVNADVQNMKPLDRNTTTFGIRTFNFDPDKGFFLNGVKTLFKGVCVHQDDGAFGAAEPLAAMRRRLVSLKELGCNAIRTSHNPPAPEFLDLCDQMGFMVMDEAFDEWARPKHKWVQGRNNGLPSFDGYSKYFDQWGVTDVKAMVERDRNHPSIILWSIGNEIDYSHDPYFDPVEASDLTNKPSADELVASGKRLAEAVRAADPTRPVTAALANMATSNKTGLPEVLDVVGYNYQEADYVRDHADHPRRVIVGSENSHAYSAWKPIVDLPYANGQFLWTGFDYLGESSGWPTRGSGAGLIDEAGFKKPAFYFRQSLWSDKPMVAIASTAAARAASPQTRPRGGAGQAGRGALPTWNLPVGPINVGVNSNCDEVELQLNGTSVGRQPRSAAQNGVISFNVPYAGGTLRAVGYNRDKEVCSTELKTTGPAKAIHLEVERSNEADHQRYFFIDVSAADPNGNLVTSANTAVAFKVTGPGRLRALDSGDLRSLEDFKASSRALYQGRLLAIIERSAGTTDAITIDASALDLAGATVVLK